MAALKKILQRVRIGLLIRDHPYAFWQHPRAADASFTSTGSVPKPKVANRGEDPYYTSEFVHNTSKMPDKSTTIAHTTYGDLLILKEQFRGRSSPGRPIPAVQAYDPSGLRTTPTANWKALDEALAKLAPNHFPKTWPTDEEFKQMVAESTAKGRPIPHGVTYKWKKVSDNFNKVRW